VKPRAFALGNTSGTPPGIAVENNNAYVTGFTTSQNFPVTPNAKQGALGGGFDAFVAKLTPTGNALVYATYLGGSDWDEGHAIAVSGGYAYVTGETKSQNFPTAGAPVQGTHGVDQGGFDAFLTKVNQDGSNWVYSTFFGGDGNDSGDAITLRNGIEPLVAGTRTFNL
jgi:hypothetical protein